MKPEINGCVFGSMTIEGQKYRHDVHIGLDGRIRKRKKKLSKAIYGTSHIISLEEAQYVYEEGAEKLIVGTGQYDQVRLSEEAEQFFQEKGLPVQLLPVQEALQAWNKAKGAVIGLFHVTC